MRNRNNRLRGNVTLLKVAVIKAPSPAPPTMIDNKSIVQKNLTKALSKSVLWLLAFTPVCFGCDPYNLDRASFPACAKPSATIGVTTDQLEATLFLDAKQGDIGVVGWDIGDGRNKMGERIKVAYSKPGTYTITAIMANSCDDKFTTSRAITVQN